MTEAGTKYLFDVTIYLKSGQSFTFRTHEWKTRKNLLGELTEIGWESVPGHPRLSHLNMDEIAAVITADVEESS